MSIAELKTSLHTAIESIDDEQLLTRYLQLLMKEVNAQQDFDLTLEQQAAIDEAEAEIDAGLGIPHAKVKERLKLKYPGIVKWK